ncbi:unnamed protein product [Adineta ricciae]|uniref:BZIP domain-containing protein n=1 Tax=Adineta ricciae TaxID=249248 RepID=A0A815DDS8_ADIRI|nr:unnamed protein product [Adineta ricciae]
MDRRNVVFSVVQDRSKIQTFAPTLFTMSNQAQETAEKSVQTQDSNGPSSAVLVTNNPENTATEVANTLVSMATGRQRVIPTVKQLNVITVSNPSSTSTTTVTATPTLPILSLADYTTSRGVPTASALANQAKLTPLKQDDILENNDNDSSMLTEDYNQLRNENNSASKSRRGKSAKSVSNSKNTKSQVIEPIQYGPILVKPRKQIAPTLASGRKSKDEPLPPEENVRRQQRRDRNKQAAAKCRKKRNELREQLEKTEQILTEQQQNLQRSVQSLSDQKNQLESLLHRHACLRKAHLPTVNNLNLTKNDVKTLSTSNVLDPNNMSTTDTLPSSSATTTSTGVPMITIHILPEVAQALLGSTSLDKAKLAELLQQANTPNSSSSTTITTTTTDSAPTNNTN